MALTEHNIVSNVTERKGSENILHYDLTNITVLKFSRYVETRG